MLENTTDSSAPTATVKRYAPPNQRNRVPSRRKSGDRLERTSSLYGNDGEKSRTSSRIIPILDHGEAGSSKLNENPHPGLIAINGCCSSEAAQLLNDRLGQTGLDAGIIFDFPSWTWFLNWSLNFMASRVRSWEAAMCFYHDSSIDLSERPVMYVGSGTSAWGHPRLPHHQVDFLAELRRVIRNANAGADA